MKSSNLRSKSRFNLLSTRLTHNRNISFIPNLNLHASNKFSNFEGKMLDDEKMKINDTNVINFIKG